MRVLITRRWFEPTFMFLSAASELLPQERAVLASKCTMFLSCEEEAMQTSADKATLSTPTEHCLFASAHTRSPGASESLAHSRMVITVSSILGKPSWPFIIYHVWGLCTDFNKEPGNKVLFLQRFFIKIFIPSPSLLLPTQKSPLYFSYAAQRNSHSTRAFTANTH